MKGIDKEKVGQFAAEIRDKRRPEPYKGKGISFSTVEAATNVFPTVSSIISAYI